MEGRVLLHRRTQQRLLVQQAHLAWHLGYFVCLQVAPLSAQLAKDPSTEGGSCTEGVQHLCWANRSSLSALVAHAIQANHEDMSEGDA